MSDDRPQLKLYHRSFDDREIIATFLTWFMQNGERYAQVDDGDAEDLLDSYFDIDTDALKAERNLDPSSEEVERVGDSLTDPQVKFLYHLGKKGSGYGGSNPVFERCSDKGLCEKTRNSGHSLRAHRTPLGHEVVNYLDSLCTEV